MRVLDEFKDRLTNEAERRGFTISEFVQSCCIKEMDGSNKTQIEDEIRNQIELVCQLVLYSPSWIDNENLIKKEVQFLWNLLSGKPLSLKP